MKHRLACYIAAFWPLLVLGGCATFPWLRPQPDPPLPPPAFNGPPTLADVIRAVNANSDRISQLQTQGAKLSLPGAPALPALRADLAIERPCRFRMRAEFMGATEFDLGANDEAFWLWMRRGQEPAVYWVRRDQFASSAARSILPIEPDWLAEAIGVVRLDEAGEHWGPFPRGVGRIEIHSRVRALAGEFTKTTVVDDTYGWVLEQHLYDPTGRLAASARASQHRLYPLTGVSLPHLVEVQISSPDGSSWLSLQLEVSRYLINQLYADPARLWAPPRQEGYPLINLGDPRFLLTPPGPGGQAAPDNGRRLSKAPGQDPYRPTYRGFDAAR